MSSDDVELSHEGNVLGALTLAVDDRVAAAMAEAAGGWTVAAALSSMADFLDQPTIGRLQDVLGLTPSGAVRLVDRMAELGLVERSRGSDLRTRHVTLTRTGRGVAARVRAARAAAIELALAGLGAAERRTLDDLLGRLLVSTVATGSGAGWTCRLCDTRACGRQLGRCPFWPDGPPADEEREVRTRASPPRRRRRCPSGPG